MQATPPLTHFCIFSVCTAGDQSSRVFICMYTCIAPVLQCIGFRTAHSMSINRTVARFLVVCGAAAVILYISFVSLQHTSETSTSQTGDTLFGDFSRIRHCITTDVIGLRPSALLIPFNKLVHHKETENSHKRKASFESIFSKKIWGSNRQVNFSGSGKHSLP